MKTREIFLAGIPQKTTPKVFDLLVYLIENRDRVVSRDELLEKVWLNRVLSETVVARAVMHARRSIGDVGDQPELIKTVQKIGYRFMGEPEISIDPPGPSLEPAPIRIALLPFHNETGDRQFAWIELGLLSLVGQALEGDRRLSVESTNQVLGALKEISPSATDAMRATQLQRLLNVNCVIVATITRAHSAFNLTFRGFGEKGDALGGALESLELTSLAGELASLIGANLIARDAVYLKLESSDAFTNECFARAMRAADEKKWREAANLFRVALDLEPESFSGRIRYFEALAELGDSSAFEIGQQLLIECQDRGNFTLEARLNHSLAVAHIESRREPEKAEIYLDRAVALSQADPLSDQHIRTLSLRGYLYQSERNDSAAREVYLRALTLSKQSGNQIRLLTILNNTANLEISAGNILGGRDSFEYVLALSRQHGRPLTEIAALINLANVNGMLGLFGRAVKHGREGLSQLSKLKDPPQKLIESPVSICRIFGELRMVEPIKEAIADLDKSFWTSTGVVARASRATAIGCLHWAQGDARAAAAHMLEAIHLTESIGNFRSVRSWFPFLVRAQIEAGEFANAAQTRRRARISNETLKDEEMEAALLHSEAVEAYLDSREQIAKTLLQKAIALAPTGYWRAISSLDLAWIHLNDFELNRAIELVRHIQPWLDEHPVGLVIAERLKSMDVAEKQSLTANQRLKPATDLRSPALPSSHRASSN